MTVTSVEKDLDTSTLTLTAEFDASVDRVWALWSDPRKLERWWGPPEYPATVDRHELRPGGTVDYYMTGPEGEKYRGRWTITAVEAPRAVDFTDEFVHDDGTVNSELPVTTSTMRLVEHGGGTRMELRSTFASREDMQTLLTMGMDEGLESAAGQMDALLTE